MQELMNNLRSHINERLNSPLMGAYLFSWLFVNYRVPLILFSDLPVFRKITEIEQYLYGTRDNFLHAFGWPATIALIIVFVIPIPAMIVSAWTLLTQNWTAKLQQLVLKKRVIFQEQFDKAESEWQVERDALRTKLHETETRIEAQRAQREKAESDLQTMTIYANEARTAKEQLPSVLSELESLRSKHQQLTQDHMFTQETLASKEKEAQAVKNIISGFLKKLKNREDNMILAQYLNDEMKNTELAQSIPDWLPDQRNKLSGMLG